MKRNIAFILDMVSSRYHPVFCRRRRRRRRRHRCFFKELYLVDGVLMERKQRWSSR